MPERYRPFSDEPETYEAGDRDRYGRDRYAREERGLAERGDEVRSWAGDDEAAYRRRLDQENRPYGGRDYGWRGTARDDRYEYTRPENTEYSRQTYAGPYGRERFGAREWSSTESWRVPGPHAGRGPRGYLRSDERIREDINDRLTAHGLIDATDVECRVQTGEVTLTGFVDSRAAKRAAEDLAEDVHGVREVHNQLRVRSHADDQGVGRTSVLGLTDTQEQTPAGLPESERSRTRR